MVTVKQPVLSTRDKFFAPALSRGSLKGAFTRSVQGCVPCGPPYTYCSLPVRVGGRRCVLSSVSGLFCQAPRCRFRPRGRQCHFNIRAQLLQTLFRLSCPVQSFYNHIRILSLELRSKMEIRGIRGMAAKAVRISKPASCRLAHWKPPGNTHLGPGVPRLPTT